MAIRCLRICLGLFRCLILWRFFEGYLVSFCWSQMRIRYFRFLVHWILLRMEFLSLLVRCDLRLYPRPWYLRNDKATDPSILDDTLESWLRSFGRVHRLTDHRTMRVWYSRRTRILDRISTHVNRTWWRWPLNKGNIDEISYFMRAGQPLKVIVLFEIILLKITRLKWNAIGSFIVNEYYAKIVKSQFVIIINRIAVVLFEFSSF